ncbi:MAG TPA: hypothetical protein VG458_03505, partial [Solirubrobacterales bacterium]|nr:hypothetical protein [Solirubrobacterales bacterium]
MHLPAQRGFTPRGLVLSVSAVALFVLAVLLWLAPSSRAAELVFWNNYGAVPQTISVANADGSGGGPLNLTGTTLVDPEGMAIDTATGRLFVASSSGAAGKGEILAVNLNGSGAAVFTAPGAPVDEPFGVAIDPVTRTIYWANAGAGEANGSIAWAKLDGTTGGVLDTTGVTVDDPYKLAIDPVNNRVYWGNYPGSSPVIAYANLNNTGGGGTLALSAAVVSAYAFAVDPLGGRLYWSEGSEDRFAYTGLLGGAVTILDVTGAEVNGSYGFAVDPTLNKISWSNYSNAANRVNGLGFASLSGGGGGNITPPVAPFDGPQDLLVLKSPTGTSAPAITRAKGNRSKLTCSTGAWAADFAGSYVYQAPTTYAYQWLRNGAVLAGATAATLTAKSAGKYTCNVTGANQAGGATIASALANIAASKARLKTKKKATVKPGGTATFALKVTNQGDLQPKKVTKVCVRLPKAARGELKAPKCKS